MSVGILQIILLFAHPHSHIIVRGVTEDGKTLNIAGDYIAHGVRERASEIVTRELGRQSELEVTRQLEREVDADRFTRLDRMLIVEQQGRKFADLRPDRDVRETVRQNRALLIERAHKLQRMGLATEVEAGQWVVSPKADPEAFVRSHVRRLEALRRAGHAERIDADHWRVPADLPERGQAYDLARDRANIRISVLSRTGLDQQIGHDGATWLDRELVSRQRTALAGEGSARR